MRIILAAAAIALAAGAAGAQPAPREGWRGERRLAIAHEATLGGAPGFLRFRCLILAGSWGMGPSAELLLAVTFRTGPLRGAFDTVVVTAGEQSLQFRADPDASRGDVARYLWTSGDMDQIDGPGLRLVNDAMLGVVVKAPNGAQEVFPPVDAVALGEIRRCSTSSILAVQRAAALNANQLLPLWGQGDENCRGGFPPDNATACDQRAAYGERLQQLGYCYGRPGDAGYQMRWRRCRG